MKVKLLCVGGVRDAAISKAIDMYARRIPHYWPFSMVCIPDVKGARDQKGQKSLEGAKILAETAPGDFLMLLDERGKQYTSRQWADFLQKKSVELPRTLVLTVGLRPRRCHDFAVGDDFSTRTCAPVCSRADLPRRYNTSWRALSP